MYMQPCNNRPEMLTYRSEWKEVWTGYLQHVTMNTIGIIFCTVSSESK